MTIAREPFPVKCLMAHLHQGDLDAIAGLGTVPTILSDETETRFVLRFPLVQGVQPEEALVSA